MLFLARVVRSRLRDISVYKNHFNIGMRPSKNRLPGPIFKLSTESDVDLLRAKGWCEFCANPPFYLINTETGEVSRPQCNRPRVCRRAAEYSAWRLAQRLSTTPWRTFATLTMPAAFGEPNQLNIRRQSKAWSRLYRHLRRSCGTFRYAFSTPNGSGYISAVFVADYHPDLATLSHNRIRPLN